MLWWSRDDTDFHSVHSDTYRLLIRGATELSLRLSVWLKVLKK